LTSSPSLEQHIKSEVLSTVSRFLSFVLTNFWNEKALSQSTEPGAKVLLIFSMVTIVGKENQFEILWAQRQTFEEINIVLSNVPIYTLYRWEKQLKSNGNLNTFKGVKQPSKYSEREINCCC
jgi:hypothetical protein